jgi:hypothetical protein
LPLERIKNGMAMQDNYCYNLRESLKTPTMEDDGNYTIHSYIALAGVVSGIILYYGSLPDYSQANRQEQEAIQDQIWRQVHKDMEYGQFVNNSDNKFWKYK